MTTYSLMARMLVFPSRMLYKKGTTKEVYDIIAYLYECVTNDRQICEINSVSAHCEKRYPTCVIFKAARLMIHGSSEKHLTFCGINEIEINEAMIKIYIRTTQSRELGRDVQPGQQCVLLRLRHTCGL
ncbi:hypothetical protein EVAR_10922_1 [Eumeta japonica]|uniref:Uncharacterized protein n=1 Tax=Eumeta variegata TaxID=151549 RepID=A0A4C1U5X8_EUMVA|nr:hypothetical protein EVAR_10922_1 [Eumeta japonica]